MAIVKTSLLPPCLLRLCTFCCIAGSGLAVSPARSHAQTATAVPPATAARPANAGASRPGTRATVEYRFSFPDAVHHIVDVDATFRNLPPGPLDVQMSRSSPGRYAAFEFASNLFREQFTDGAGHPLAVTRPDPAPGASPVTTARYTSPIACLATASTAPFSRRTQLMPT